MESQDQKLVFKVKKVEKYFITQKIGEGVQGTTFKCYHEDNPSKVYCAKQVSRRMLTVDQDAKKLFERELLLLRMIRSPYFVKIHDILKS